MYCFCDLCPWGGCIFQVVGWCAFYLACPVLHALANAQLCAAYPVFAYLMHNYVLPTLFLPTPSPCFKMCTIMWCLPCFCTYFSTQRLPIETEVGTQIQT